MKRYAKDGCCVCSARFSVLYFDLNNILDGRTFATEKGLGCGLNKSNWNDIFVGILVFSSYYGLIFPLETIYRFADLISVLVVNSLADSICGY